VKKNAEPREDQSPNVGKATKSKNVSPDKKDGKSGASQKKGKRGYVNTAQLGVLHPGTKRTMPGFGGEDLGGGKGRTGRSEPFL